MESIAGDEVGLVWLIEVLKCLVESDLIFRESGMKEGGCWETDRNLY